MLVAVLAAVLLADVMKAPELEAIPDSVAREAPLSRAIMLR